MKLYAAKEPKTSVDCDNGVLRVKVGSPPLSIVIQMGIWGIILLVYLLFCLFMWVRLTWYYLLTKEPWDIGLVAFFGVELFLLAGALLMFWCVKRVLDDILPFSAEVCIDKRRMVCGHRLWHRRCQFIGEVQLLVEPVYSRGGWWGFALRIVSNGKKYKLLPCASGSSYYKARAKARKLAAQIQACMPFIKIEESKYWKYH